MARRPATPLVSLVCVLAMLGTFAVANAPSAVAATCRVENVGTDRVYVGHGANLQRAIDAASANDHLRITGLCVGSFRLDVRLDLIGVPSARFPRPTLDANGEGRVLTLEVGATVRSLRIKDGRARVGGGIYSIRGRLRILGHTTVVSNRARFGGGILVERGVVNVRGSTVVKGNDAALGGGLYVGDYARGWLLGHSTIRDNHARLEGGGVAAGVRQFSLQGFASIRSNHSGGSGGGIVSLDGYLEFRGHTTVVGNTAAETGGGVYLNFASMVVCSPHVVLSPNVPDDPPDSFVNDPRC